ncbi:MAG: HEAT repeat domain-containing protein [Planctomycetota bacterium]|jgi:HEAT repeat protein
MTRFWAVLLLLPALAAPTRAQENEDEGETEITAADGGPGDDSVEVIVDPFAKVLANPEEPNRPEPIQVGVWHPEDDSMDAEAKAILERLLAERGARPDDVAVRYRLAEHYLKHKWYLQAEAEFKRCAELDPESIRPWEGLLRAYRSGLPKPQEVFTEIFIGPGGQFTVRNEQQGGGDWLPSIPERNRRITHAYEELLKRRPEDFARRRELIRHLETVGDDSRLAAQAREILRRLPAEAHTRYELAEAMRRLGVRKEQEKQGLGTPEWDEAVRLLEENLERSPDHVASALRLARMLAHQHGSAARERILELEQRAFFRLFVRSDFGSAPYAADSVRMARSLAGRGIANNLWDEKMVPRPEDGNDTGIRSPDPPFYDRWVFLSFPHSTLKERSRVITSLGRRSDEAVVAVLLSFLWHLPGYDDPAQERQIDKRETLQPQEEALKAAIALGSICYPGADRFVRASRSPLRVRRGVSLLRGLKDRRAVDPLLVALDWDNREDFSYGVAQALEEIGNPRAIDGLVEAVLDVQRPAARRREAAEALASFKDPRSVEAINRLAKEMEFRLVTAYGLFRLTGDVKAFTRMQEIMISEGRADEVFRLSAKCDDPRVEGLLLNALERSEEAEQPRIVEMLRARYWESAEEKVSDYFLRSEKITLFGIRMLGEIGGAKAIDRLLSIVRSDKGERWTAAARALAETGDELAVREFSRMKILERNEEKRRQARAFHEIALRRRAEREKAASR